MTYGQKIDDEDGHYVVVADAGLGDRCRPSCSTKLREADTDNGQTKSHGSLVKELSGKWLKLTTNDHEQDVQSRSFDLFRSTVMRHG